MLQFHPDGEDLLDYAAGHLAEPFGVVIACHLTFCPACRRTVAALEAVGGAALEAGPAADLVTGGLERLLARLDEPAPKPAALPAVPGAVERLPAPLRLFMDRPPTWRRKWRGLEEADVGPEGKGMHARLMRVVPGAAMPRHTHRGREMLIVLDGGYRDELGDHGAGDIAIADGSLVHRPIADPVEGCLAFAVTDAPVRLTGPLGWIINPFVR
jgi:putative transcriptional regulator